MEIIRDDNKQRIIGYLVMMAKTFTPSLHDQVEIEGYADKLASHAVNLFLTDGLRDWGYAALYVNDTALKRAFISSISVCPELHGLGHAQQLMRHVEQLAQQLDMTAITLEVNRKNPRALHFYQRLGFIPFNEKTDTMIMIKSLSQRSAEALKW